MNLNYKKLFLAIFLLLACLGLRYPVLAETPTPTQEINIPLDIATATLESLQPTPATPTPPTTGSLLPGQGIPPERLIDQVIPPTSHTWMVGDTFHALVELAELGTFLSQELLDVRLPVVISARDEAALERIRSYTDSQGNPYFRQVQPDGAAVDEENAVVIFSQPMMGGAWEVMAAEEGVPGEGVQGLQTLTPVYTLWEYGATVANMLVLLMLVLIGYALMFRYHVSAYSVRAIFPRFLVAVVLVQFSWTICQFCFDLATVSAFSLKSLLFSIPVPYAVVSEPACLGCAPTIAPTAEEVSIGALVTAGLQPLIEELIVTRERAAALPWGQSGIWFAMAAAKGYALLLPMLLGVLIAGVVFVTFAFARMLFLYLLVILAPLALLVHAIPELRGLTRLWVQTLLILLLLYPLSFLLFGVLYTFAAAL